MFVEECLDCHHLRIINICDYCGQGKAIHVHQTEYEYCCDERLEEWSGVCEACHIAIKG